jgi:hypothetical protein
MMVRLYDLEPHVRATKLYCTLEQGWQLHCTSEASNAVQDKAKPREIETYRLEADPR